MSVRTDIMDEQIEEYELTTEIHPGLKKITGTESYLARTHHKCQLEAFETCHTKRFLKKVQRKCGCIPWLLNSFAQLEVKTKHI